METPIIDTVALRVGDLDRATAFYEGILGLHVRNAGDATREFLIAGDSSPLIRVVEAPDAKPKPASALGLYHFAMLVPDRTSLAAILRRLADAGVRLQGASDHHVSEALYLADPDGHGIEIYRDRRPNEWTYTESGELYMTTDPLNLHELISAAEHSSGLPEGTTIGHIHLHVSDIKTAEAFYAGALGFDVMVRSYPGALFVSTDGYHHHIGLNTWAGPNAAPPDDQTIGMIEFAVRAPLRPNGSRASGDAHANGGPGEGTGTGTGTNVVTDPDGIRIRLID